MKIKVHLTIGFQTADHEDIIEVDDEELADNSGTPEERENFLMEETRIWADEYIEYSYEEVK